MSTKRLSGWDLATWRLAAADPVLNSTMVGVLEVAGPVDYSTLLMRTTLAAANSEQLRSVLRDSPDSVPLLEILRELDVRPCMKLLPLGTDVVAAATAAAKRPFAYGEPLWRLRVLAAGERTYFICAMHHAIADGSGALKLMSTLIDGAPSRPAAASGQPSPALDVQESVRALLTRLVSDPLGLVADSSKVARSLMKLLGSSHASDPAVAGRSTDFGAAWIDVGPVSRPARAHHQIVAASVAAFAAIADARGSKATQVTVNVPIANASGGNNQVVVARLALPVADTPVVIEESHEQLKSWRAEPALLMADQLAEFAAQLPVEFLSAQIRNADLTVSTMPPVMGGLRVAGKPVDGIWPLVPPIGAAANVTTLPYGQRLLVGTTYDRAALSHDWPGQLRAELGRVLSAEADIVSSH